MASMFGIWGLFEIYIFVFKNFDQAAFDIFVDDVEEDAISDKNLSRLFAMLGMNPSPQELKEMVEEIDVDGSGSIDFDEFRIVSFQMVKKQRYQDTEFCTFYFHAQPSIIYSLLGNFRKR